MQTITLQALPSQTFTVPLDDNEWEIAVKDTNGAISFTFTLNGTLIIENIRAVGGRKIIPYEYSENGNFAIITQNYEVPDYTKFGNTQQLVYISADEISALRTPPLAKITASDFDPNGDLPLRFAPQGYVLA